MAFHVPPRRILTALLLLAGCGDPVATAPSAVPAPAAPGAPAPAATSADLAAERLSWDLEVEAALERAARGDPAAAREALGALKDAPGRDPVRWAAALEQVGVLERAAAAKAEARALLVELRAPPSADAPAERAAALEEIASRARHFLARWPDGDPGGEMAASLQYAEGEAGKHRAFADAMDRARAALEKGEFDAAITGADAAFALLPRGEARDLRAEAVKRNAPRGMVFVPAGNALLGREKRPVFTGPLYVDRTEVTCAAYALFLEATGHPAPAGWKEGRIPEGTGDHPVVGVCGEDAEAFAAWSGKRLPTELEWEKAVRGEDGRLYPWGDEWDEGKGNFAGKGTLPVGAHPGDFGPFGLMDGGGNALEITVPALGFRDPPPGEEKPRWVGKGGHWASGAVPLNNALYQRYPLKAGEKDGGTGFRCVKDAR